MPEAVKKRAGRPAYPPEKKNDYAITINFNQEIEAALEAYRTRCEAVPARSAVALAALKAFLAKKGWKP